MKYINDKVPFLITCLCVINVFVNAQTISSIKVKDILLHRERNILASQKNKSLSDTSSNNYGVVFKIDPASLASKVFLLFGTQKDTGNVLNAQASFTHRSGMDSIYYLGKSNPIKNYTAYMNIYIPRAQYKLIKWLTLYVQDINGNNTSRFYQLINP